MDFTEFLRLNLPSEEDYYDIEQFNQNMRRLDAQFATLDARLPKQLLTTFLSSGTFRPADFALSMGDTIDVYMVGGGSGGGTHRGGGGGFCRLLRNIVIDRATYPIVIGAGGATGQRGGTTTGFSQTTPGGGIEGFGGSGGGIGMQSAVARGSANGRDGRIVAPGNNSHGQGAGEGVFTPQNPYDGVFYGSGGSFGSSQPGGGAGPGEVNAAGNGWVFPEGHSHGGLGGGGGGTVLSVTGNGGLGGGGGGGAGTTAAAGTGGQGLVYVYGRPRNQNARAVRGLPYISVDKLSLTVMEEYIKPIATEKKVQIGIIKEGVCQNVTMFKNLTTAKEFFREGVFGDADEVTKLPKGYGMGDFYRDGTWEKAPEPAGNADVRA